MCVSASKSDEMVIEPEHWIEALELLFEVERTMPNIFEGIVTSRGFSETYEELKRFASGGKPVHYHSLISKLSRTHPAYEVKQILDLSQQDGTLVPVMDETGTLPVKPLQFYIRGNQ